MPRGADREGEETAASRTRTRTKGSECGKPGGRRGWEPEYPLGLDWEGAAFPTPRGMMSPQERARGQAAVLSRAWDLLRSQGFSTSGTQKGEGSVAWGGREPDSGAKAEKAPARNDQHRNPASAGACRPPPHPLRPPSASEPQVLPRDGTKSYPT